MDPVVSKVGAEPVRSDTGELRRLNTSRRRRSLTFDQVDDVAIWRANYQDAPSVLDLFADHCSAQMSQSRQQCDIGIEWKTRSDFGGF